MINDKMKVFIALVVLLSFKAFSGTVIPEAELDYQVNQVMQDLEKCEKSKSLSEEQRAAGETIISVCIYEQKIKLINSQAMAFVDYIARMKKSLKEDFYQRQLENVIKRYNEVEVLKSQLDEYKSHQNVGYDKEYVVNFYNEEVLESARKRGRDIEEDMNSFMSMMHHKSRFKKDAKILLNYTAILNEGRPLVHDMFGNMMLMKARSQVLMDLAKKMSGRSEN